MGGSIQSSSRAMMLVLLLLLSGYVVGNPPTINEADTPEIGSAQIPTLAEIASLWEMMEPSATGSVPVDSGSGYIHLQQESFDPLLSPLYTPSHPFSSASDLQSTGLGIIQFWDSNHESTSNIIERWDLALLDYLPDNAWVIRLPNKNSEFLNKIANDEDVRWIGAMHPGHRVSLDIIKQTVEGGRLNLSVVPAIDVAPIEIEKLQTSIHSHGAERVDCYLSRCQVWGLPSSNLNRVAMDWRVIWTEGMAELKPANANARNITNVESEWTNWNAGLNGSGEFISISDSGLDSDHGDFSGKLLGLLNDFGPDTSGADANSGHGTHVAATLLGKGSGDPEFMGIAPAAQFQMYQLEHDATGLFTRRGSLSDMFHHAKTNGMHIQSNSWGAIQSNGMYTDDSRSVDSYTFSHRDFLVFFSAGDDGGQGAFSITPPATAKNVLAIGASTTGVVGTAPVGEVANFSSTGPSLDGRIKPDLVAPGVAICSARAEEAIWANGDTCSSASHPSSGTPRYMSLDGTSSSTAVAAGVATLTRQFLREQIGISNPPSDLMRALLVNGARDLGVADTPNHIEGWGEIDLEGTLHPYGQTQYHSTWYDWNQTLSPGFSFTYTFELTGNEGMTATLAWNDQAGSANSAQNISRLVNDLDMVVRAPDGTTYHGNHFSGGQSVTGGSPDYLNNLERVELPSGLDGDWSITVSQSSGGNQPFSLVVTGVGTPNHGADLSLMPNSLIASPEAPLLGDQVALQSYWRNQAPVGTDAYDVTLTDETTGETLYESQHLGLPAGNIDSFLIMHQFTTTGDHHLRLTLDSGFDVDEINDEANGVNNNEMTLIVKVSSLGVRITPLNEDGSIPDNEEERIAASRKILSPTNEVGLTFPFRLANEGTANESVKLSMTAVRQTSEDGWGGYRTPDDSWVRELSLDGPFTLGPDGEENAATNLSMMMYDEDADLNDPHWPVFALPGDYFVVMTASYVTQPTVSHQVQFTIEVPRVDGITTVLAGTNDLSAQPGEWGTFSLSVRNPGNGLTEYQVTCETERNWLVKLRDSTSSITFEPLARLQYLPVEVAIQVPSVDGGLPASGETEEVTCTTVNLQNMSHQSVEQAELTVDDLVEFTSKLTDPYQNPVGVASEAPDVIVANQEHHNYTLFVINKGNLVTELEVSVSPEDATWPLELSCGDQSDARVMNIILEAGENTTCRIHVVIPLLADEGATNRLTIRTEFNPQNAVVNQTRMVVGRRASLAIDWSIEENTLTYLGTSNRINLTVLNDGNAILDINWSLTILPTNWVVGWSSPPPLRMVPTDEAAFSIEVMAPHNTPTGTTSQLLLEVVGTSASGLEANYRLSSTMEVSPTSLAIMTSDEANWHDLDKSTEYHGNLTVTNSGNVPATYILGVSAPEGWAASLEEEEVTLSVGESAKVRYTIKTPDKTSSSIVLVTFSSTPVSGDEYSAIQTTLSLEVSGSGATADSGLFAGLSTVEVSVVIAILSIIGLVGAYLLRRSAGGRDAGEDLVEPSNGSAMTHEELEERRKEALDTGDSLSAGSVSSTEMAAALMQSMPDPLMPPPSGLPPTPPPPLKNNGATSPTSPANLPSTPPPPGAFPPPR